MAHGSRSARLLALAITSALASASAPAWAEPPLPPQQLRPAPHACTAPKDLLRFTSPLTRTAQHLAAHLPLTIVALGSSSTQGVGASSPAASYPSRLAAELKALFPQDQITVVNRGVGGEEAREMLARFGESVVAQKPDLVIWQVGTNSVLRDRDISPTSPLILDGIRRLRALGIDVVILDPQYAPAVITKHDAEKMVHLISATAKAANVDLFPRFTLMRYWVEHDHMAFSEFLSPDGLHMNDWSYACLAKLIGTSIAQATAQEIASSQAQASLKH